MHDLKQKFADALRNGLQAFTRDAPPPGIEPGAKPGARPCNSCGEAARQRREAQRAKREADRSSKD